MNIFLASVTGNVAVLDEEESWHCARVLRKRAGDEVRLIDGKGSFFDARLHTVNDKRCEATVLDAPREQVRRNYRLHIAVAPTKQTDRIEWFVEKAVEIGVDEISFIICERSERTVLKTDRIKKIMLSAVKQSLQARLPIVNEPVKFPAFISAVNDAQKYIGWCGKGEKRDLRETKFSGASTVVLIGPEGDFTDDEVALAQRDGFVNLSLGPNRLRTETAALSVAMAAALL